MKSKVLFWLGLAIFAIPEILWSTASNLFYEFTQTSNSGGTYPYRLNFLQDSDNINILSTVLCIQALGLLLACVTSFILSSKNSKKVWLPLGVLTLILFLVTLILFGLSVSLRSVGF